MPASPERKTTWPWPRLTWSKCPRRTEVLTAADMGRQTAFGCRLQPRPDWPLPEGLAGQDRRALALTRVRGGPRTRSNPPPRGVSFGRLDGSRLGSDLDPRREVHGVTDRGVVHVQIVGDLPTIIGPVLSPTAEAAVNRVACPYVGRVLGKGRLHFEAAATARRAESLWWIGAPKRVITPRRGTGNGALVAVDGVHHARDAALHQQVSLYSWSSCSEIGVKPIASAKRTVTVRRSPSSEGRSRQDLLREVGRGVIYRINARGHGAVTAATASRAPLLPLGSHRSCRRTAVPGRGYWYRNWGRGRPAPARLRILRRNWRRPRFR